MAEEKAPAAAGTSGTAAGKTAAEMPTSGTGHDIPADVLKLFRLEVPPTKKGGEPGTRVVRREEVLSWRDHGGHVHLVTKGGQKLRAVKSEAGK